VDETGHTTTDKTAIRNAATVIVMRDAPHAPKVLMGQRGASAAFMPSKFVFPGGAVDLADAQVPLAAPINATCAETLRARAPQDFGHALAVAAIRELWEETGLVLGQRGDWDSAPPADWQGFARTGYVPSAESLRFVFRAVTPPGRPRRFDARFFLIDAGAIASDLDDFSAASDELSHLQWIALEDVRKFDLPFITEVVLAEVAGRARGTPQAEAGGSVPFFLNTEEENLFLRLRGRSPMEAALQT